MTSFGGVQYPQYPTLDAAIGYNYDQLSHSRGGHFYHHPVIEEPYTSSGSSGYADSAPSGYGSPPHFTGHSGPSSTGYAGPAIHAHPPPQPPPLPTKSSFFGGLKKGGNSAMGAITLLSFLFFVNMLQNCLKDHMDTMNPTVMVLTNPVVRKRISKLSEMNSREQSNSHESTSVRESIQVEESQQQSNEATTPTPSPSPSPSPVTIAATLSAVQHNKQTAENSPNTNHFNDGSQLPSTPVAIDEFNYKHYDSPFNYSNRTSRPYSDRYEDENYYNDRYHSPYYEDRHHWSNRRRHSHYRYDSPEFYWDHYDNRHFPNHDSYDDTSYMRIY